MRQKHTNNGFSLVELSVVLIILGLLAAGITAGNSLVKGAKVRSVITDIESFKGAMNAFVLQYDDLPGDLTNAHDYWDDGANGVCGTASDCNGNGNTYIDWGGGPNNSEAMRSWQHLTLAGLIPGNYTGVGGGSGNQVLVGVNAPASKIIPGGYSLYKHTWFSVTGNAIQFGTERNNTSTANNIVSPRDASAIDKKIDDGLPEYGKVMANNQSGTSNCFIGSAWSRTYKLTYDDIGCRVLFFME